MVDAIFNIRELMCGQSSCKVVTWWYESRNWWNRNRS